MREIARTAWKAVLAPALEALSTPARLQGNNKTKLGGTAYRHVTRVHVRSALRRASHHRLRAVHAPPRINRNLAQTLRALLGGGIRRSFSAIHARHQSIHRRDHKEVNRRGNQQKIHQRGYECSIRE